MNDSVEAQALTCVMNLPFMVMRAPVFDPIAGQRALHRLKGYHPHEAQKAKEAQELQSSLANASLMTLLSCQLNRV